MRWSSFIQFSAFYMLFLGLFTFIMFGQKMYVPDATTFAILTAAVAGMSIVSGLANRFFGVGFSFKDSILFAFAFEISVLLLDIYYNNFVASGMMPTWMWLIFILPFTLMLPAALIIQTLGGSN